MIGPILRGALRVDRLAALGELLPRLEVGVDLVAVHGLEGQVHRVVDGHLVADRDLGELLEVGLAHPDDDDVVADAGEVHGVADGLAAEQLDGGAEGAVGHRLGEADGGRQLGGGASGHRHRQRQAELPAPARRRSPRRRWSGAARGRRAATAAGRGRGSRARSRSPRSSRGRTSGCCRRAPPTPRCSPGPGGRRRTTTSAGSRAGSPRRAPGAARR